MIIFHFKSSLDRSWKATQGSLSACVVYLLNMEVWVISWWENSRKENLSKVACYPNIKILLFVNILYGNNKNIMIFKMKYENVG